MRSGVGAVVVLGACYAPQIHSGSACAPGDLCPAGLVCVMGQCVGAGGAGGGGGGGGGGMPMPDSRAPDTAMTTEIDAADIPDAPPSKIAFVQGAYASSSSSSFLVQLMMPTAQTAGDLEVVFVSWSTPSASISRLEDTGGNAYVEAVAPSGDGQSRLAAYYAANITGGPNDLLVVFTASADQAELRIVEYRGVDANAPLDGSQQASGTGATCDSGPLTTTTAGDLVVAGNAVAGTATQGAGPGFTSHQISAGGNIIEDKIAGAPTTLDATAPLAGASAWKMAAVAFRPAP